MDLHSSLWSEARAWLSALWCGLVVLGALLLALWIWWLIWYIDERPDCCDDDEPYLPEEDLCNDTGQYVDFSCYNDTFCTVLGEQNTSLDCLGDVNITDPKDGDIINWNSTSEMWENEECDPCTNGTDGDDGLDCWDISGNGLCDLQLEDINDDGVCNVTDCIGPAGKDGVDGMNATIEGCVKPFGTMVWVEGNVTQEEYLMINVTAAGEWYPIEDEGCQVLGFRNMTYIGNCTWMIDFNESYVVQSSISFVTTGQENVSVGYGYSINGNDPLLIHQTVSHGITPNTITFTVGGPIDAGTTIGLMVTNTENTEDILIRDIHLNLIGNLVCAALTTGPRGDPGIKGDKGDDGFHCWDLNENYSCDLGTEDINDDGACNVTDCTLQNITDMICGMLGEGATLSCLGDVNVTDVQDCDLIKYNNETELFENKQLEISCESLDTSENDPYLFSSNLIGFWNFNELEGNRTEDKSTFGNATDLEDGPDSSSWRWRYPCGVQATSGGTVWRSGDGSGTDDTADKIIDAIKSSGEYSVELWLQTTDTSQTGPARIMTIGNSGATDCDETNPIMFGMSGSDFVWRRPDGPSTCNALTVTNALDTDYLDTQLVVTYDGTDAFIYQDGMEEASDTLASSIGDWTSGYEMAIFDNVFLIGSDERPWVGIIYKIAIWDRELTPSEVTSTFQSGPCYPRECSCNCATAFT